MCGTQVNTGGSSLGDVLGPENEEKITELAHQLRVQCLRAIAVIPQCSTQGLAGYDISAAYSYVIHAKGKGVVQTELAVSLPSRVYARIALCSGLAI